MSEGPVERTLSDPNFRAKIAIVSKPIGAGYRAFALEIDHAEAIIDRLNEHGLDIVERKT